MIDEDDQPALLNFALWKQAMNRVAALPAGKGAQDWHTAKPPAEDDHDSLQVHYWLRAANLLLAGEPLPEDVRAFAALSLVSLACGGSGYPLDAKRQRGRRPDHAEKKRRALVVSIEMQKGKTRAEAIVAAAAKCHCDDSQIERALAWVQKFGW